MTFKDKKKDGRGSIQLNPSSLANILNDKFKKNGGEDDSYSISAISLGNRDDSSNISPRGKNYNPMFKSGNFLNWLYGSIYLELCKNLRKLIKELLNCYEGIDSDEIQELNKKLLYYLNKVKYR